MTPAALDTGARTDLVRVLLVEDSVDHQMLTKRALARAGMDVIVSGSAEEALEVLGSSDEDVHLVLIDHGLPRMSGMDLLERVVAMPDGPGAIMVTAAAASEMVVQSMRNGAVDFVSKESGYLDLLPAVVERAYRQYDLRRRTGELQRLALLVHRSTDLEETVGEVVAGISKLLRTQAAVLLLEEPEDPPRWRVAARSGEPAALTDDEAQAMASQEAGGGDIVEEPGRLAVHLPVELDEQTGTLVVARSADRPWLAEERELARTFAAYVSSALRHVRRAALEGGLIEELQQTIRARRDFVASVSHELRTPLTSIGGYAETIVRRADRLDEETKMDLVERIGRNAADLERMIDQLIDVAKLERGTRFTPSLERLPLHDTIATSLRDLQPIIGDAEVFLDAGAQLEVVADRELLHRVIANLLTNAVKYTRGPARIDITTEAQDAYVEVVVRDHGIGIDPADAALVFQPFWRAGYAVAQAVRGAGIGLALVREYVAVMSGEVGVRLPADGTGSAFWFTLPTEPVTEASPPSPEVQITVD